MALPPQPVLPPVVPLSAVGRDDLDLAGGKAANLGEMVRAGLPVPPGFVVTTVAYQQILEAEGLAERIREMMPGDPEGTRIRAAVTTAGLPAGLADAIREAYHTLGAVPVAVRSSATAEDRPDAAAAGQQDTYLNVTGAEAVIDAVRRCWASLWSERAIAYRHRTGIDSLGTRIAVVVQEMIPADAAGVLFTADPVSGDRSTMVAHASAGLGEAVVSGAVTADHIVLDRRTGRVRHARAGRREVEFRPRPGGGVERVEHPHNSAEAGDGLAVPERVLRELVALGRTVEERFGAPQDIEWAWADRRLWLVQARPITALPEPLPELNRPQRLILRMVDELMPMRPYPLDVTTWSPALFAGATSVPRYFGIRASTFEQICVAEDGVVASVRPPRVHPGPGVALAPLRLLWLAVRYRPDRWRRDPMVSQAWTRTREWERWDLTALSWAELLDLLRRALRLAGLIGEIRRRYAPRALLAMVGLRLALVTLGRRDEFGSLVATVPTETTASNRALERLGEQIRHDPALAMLFRTHDPAGINAALRDPRYGGFRDALVAFLDRYGHRETVALLASQPTWKDEPELVLALLKGLAAEPPPAGSDRGATAERALRTPLPRRWSPSRAIVAGLLRRARIAQQIREDSHFYATTPMPTIRRVMLEFGRRLVGAGVLDEPANVFHLTLSELEQVRQWPPDFTKAAELSAAARRRAAARAALSNRPLLDPRLLATGRTAAGQPADALLTGTPGSPGTAEGPVRIVRDPAEFGTVRPGDIVVAPYTNPTWTPLFQRAAAVVVDSGSAGSHAAVVAREYGIPALMGTGDGTLRLRPGQRVRVDADRGVVVDLPEEPAARDEDPVSP